MRALTWHHVKRVQILLRKGGIKEPTFKPAARDFVLFPTSFHTDVKVSARLVRCPETLVQQPDCGAFYNQSLLPLASSTLPLQLLRPTAAKRYAAETAYDPRAQQRLEFATAARVTGAWTTMDPAVLQLLEGLHVWAPGFLENRLRWRPRQPITVLEVRAYRLAQPLLLEPRDEFWGCFSWVLLEEAAQQGLEEAPSGGPPALDDDAFAERQELCRQQLSQLPDLQELALDAL